MWLTNRVTGDTQLGSLNPGVVYDRDAGLGQSDEMIAQGLFGPSLTVNISLVDLDGIAFDGAIPRPGYSGSLLPASPPPLSMFETATVFLLPVPGSVQILQISALPEPVLGLLLLPLAAAALLRSRRPAR